MKIALICGGPSLERGISLNSARSVMDALDSKAFQVVPVYFDAKRRPFQVSPAQLYSNTPADFDFKLQHTATQLTDQRLKQLLKKVDLVFPVMHGPFGEDGEIQTWLEKNNLPFVGSGSAACKLGFDKFSANNFIQAHGFYTLPTTVLKIYHRDHKKVIQNFFDQHQITRAVVKPASGGSSIGVFSVSTPDEALNKVQYLFSKRMDTRVVLQPFAQGVEFTTILLKNRFGIPVSLPPTEIETDYTEHQIFDFRRKYLPTRQVTWHCPPRFGDQAIETIQAQAEQLFALLGMRDFARFDGWVLPDGKIWFADFNPISGMEQNSFLFAQASRVGLTHAEVLWEVVASAARRYGVSMPSEPQPKIKQKTRKPVHVLFGGATSERQVSLMSGKNVWLKLRNSTEYEPIPFLLDAAGGVWKVPYQLLLSHTVEEITENCLGFQAAEKRMEQFEQRVRLHLGLNSAKSSADFFPPERMTLTRFIQQAPFVFIALHGGAGEDGTLQAQLAKAHVPFNGPNAKVSAVCMDKWLTSQAIQTVGIPGVTAIPGESHQTAELIRLSPPAIAGFWKQLRKNLQAISLVVKPRADGCSTGVVHLYSSRDLRLYIDLLKTNTPRVPQHTFKHQPEVIEMPPHIPQELLFEQFVETDALRMVGSCLQYTRRSGWVETTVGVVGQTGKMHALNPSITVVDGEVLSVEEKFQGGTGINITPPPAHLMKPKILARSKRLVEELAHGLGISNYSRIDTFVNLTTGDLRVIEVNTLPALTGSTVLFQQALAEQPAVYPRQFLEQLIRNTGY